MAWADLAQIVYEIKDRSNTSRVFEDLDELEALLSTRSKCNDADRIAFFNQYRYQRKFVTVDGRAILVLTLAPGQTVDSFETIRKNRVTVDAAWDDDAPFKTKASVPTYLEKISDTTALEAEISDLRDEDPARLASWNR